MPLPKFTIQDVMFVARGLAYEALLAGAGAALRSAERVFPERANNSFDSALAELVHTAKLDTHELEEVRTAATMRCDPDVSYVDFSSERSAAR